MILTVTINPALDETLSADRLAFEDRGYILSRGESAGGRGLNASALLHAWGEPALALFPAGGETGQRLRAGLEQNGYPFEMVPVSSPTRRNLIITDRQGLTVKLNEPGHSLTQEELDRLEEAVSRRLAQAQWLMLCGSLPEGVPPAAYRRLIRAARQRGVKTLLDTDGAILQDALLEAPSVVTPNRQEASALLNLSLIHI